MREAVVCGKDIGDGSFISFTDEISAGVMFVGVAWIARVVVVRIVIGRCAKLVGKAGLIILHAGRRIIISLDDPRSFHQFLHFFKQFRIKRRSKPHKVGIGVRLAADKGVS